VLGIIPATALLTQQYLASMLIASFCASYSYMNAGQPFASGSASCSNFGNLYVPTTSTFQASVQALITGTYGSEPSAVQALSNNLRSFASTVQTNPAALGQTKGSYSGSQVKSFSLSFFLSDNATSDLYHGNLVDGSIRFTLTPSSDLLLQNDFPFEIQDANPRVVNIQAYWRGVTSPIGGLMATTIDVGPPYYLYEKNTGLGVAYQLPSFQTEQTPHFASSEGIEVAQTSSCGTGSTKVKVHWSDGSKTTICTADSNVNQPYPGLASSDFLFPSLWAAWDVTATPSLWSSSAFKKNNGSLALQVVFQYIASSTTSSKSLQQCLFPCLDYANQYSWDVSPLLGEAFCTESNCDECQALSFPNKTDGFCRCNVWDTTAEACPPSSGLAAVDTSSFTISATSTHGRRLVRSKQDRRLVKNTKTSKKIAAHVEKFITEKCQARDAYSVSLNEQKVVSKGASNSLTFSFEIRYDALTSNHTGTELKTAFESCTVRTMEHGNFTDTLAKDGSFCHVGIVDSVGKAIGNGLNKCVHK
jgi:hypothetical protein